MKLQAVCQPSKQSVGACDIFERETLLVPQKYQTLLSPTPTAAQPTVTFPRAATLPAAAGKVREPVCAPAAGAAALRETSLACRSMSTVWFALYVFTRPPSASCLPRLTLAHDTPALALLPENAPSAPARVVHGLVSR